MPPRIARLLVVGLATLLLAGCAAAPAADPIGPRQRAQIRESILDDKWRDVLRAYPDALRPPVTTMRTVTDHEHQEALYACLRSSGIPASPGDNGFRYRSSLGQSQREFVATTYACSASFPAASEVVSYLIASQRKALFDYQVSIVRPCLLASGAASPPPPDGGPTYYLNAALAQWSPYLSIWRDAAPATVAYLEQRCPPLPAWLDLNPPGISGAGSR